MTDDPYLDSQLRSIGERVGQLAEKMAVLIERGAERDKLLAELSVLVANMRASALTVDELKEARVIIAADARAKWLWAGIRLYIYWAAGVATTVYALRDWIGAFLKRLFS